MCVCSDAVVSVSWSPAPLLVLSALIPASTAALPHQSHSPGGHQLITAQQKVSSFTRPFGGAALEIVHHRCLVLYCFIFTLGCWLSQVLTVLTFRPFVREKLWIGKAKWEPPKKKKSSSSSHPAEQLAAFVRLLPRLLWICWALNSNGPPWTTNQHTGARRLIGWSDAWL